VVQPWGAGQPPFDASFCAINTADELTSKIMQAAVPTVLARSMGFSDTPIGHRADPQFATLLSVKTTRRAHTALICRHRSGQPLSGPPIDLRGRI
jgi:hypothetical protein